MRAAVPPVVVLMLGSCLFFTGDGGPIEYTASGEEISLAWDPASSAEIAGTPSAVDHYELYYRQYGTHDWSLMGTTEGNVTTYTISSADVDYGRYEFAVRSVRVDGSVSDFHLSSDFEADPAGGWYLHWIP